LPEEGWAVYRKYKPGFEVAGAADQYDYVRGACPYLSAGKSGKHKYDGKPTERTLVYLHPAGGKTDHLVILDRVDTGNPAYQPHVTFNTPLEPWVGASWRDRADSQVVVEGQWAARNAPCVIVTNDTDYGKAGPWGGYGNVPRGRAHARAFVKTLHPAEIEVLKIGGQKHYFDMLDGTGTAGHTRLHHFEETLKAGDRRAIVLKGGLWRFHVVPTAARSKHAILHAMELTDSKLDRPAGSLELLTGDAILGAQAGQNVVLFSKDGRRLSTVSVKTAAEATRIVVADLTPETEYTLTAGGKELKLASTTAGTIFTGEVKLPAGGTIELKK
jgi:hypothetical protein